MPSWIGLISAITRRKPHATAVVQDNMFGLYPLHPPYPQPENWTPGVDIIAIHGLCGHPINTWSHGNTLWLRDLLPQRLSALNLRVSSFGYNSSIFGRSYSVIRTYAEQLLNELHEMRRDTNTTGIPIIFICHSLGGIVCKKALIQAHARTNLYQDIISSTKGIVFMGTPHLGSDKAVWAEFFARIGSIPMIGSAETDLLKDLKPKSREFGDIAASFVQRATGLRFVSMYECRPTYGFQVVDETSAVMHHQNERPIAVECNHVEICQLSGMEGYYRTVSGAVVELVEQICLVPKIHTRRDTIAEKHDDTFEWIWEHPQFTKWESRGESTLLWLRGKPASGKSTLTKSVRLGLGQRPCRGAFPLLGIVDFFYSDRGGEAQRSHKYMLRSILYQLLLTVQGCWGSCREVYLDWRTNNAITDPLVSLDFDTLKLMFTQLITNIRSPSILYVIIDAMDESEEIKRKQILHLLASFCNSTECSLILKFFVASRPTVGVGIDFRNHLVLLLEDETGADIQHYVHSETMRISDAMDIYPSLLNEVVDNLIKRSKGVFLWVKLVILELEEQASTAGCTVADIENLLSSLPSELEDLYARILDKTAKFQITTSTVAVQLLQWVAYSVRPLTLPEVQEAMAVDICGKSFSNTDLERNKLINPIHAERRLIALCGGLIEVKNNIVQFLHQTAREFLFNLPESSQFCISKQSGGEYITSICNRYLDYIQRTASDGDHRVMDFFEGLCLFDYAMSHLYHPIASHESLSLQSRQNLNGVEALLQKQLEVAMAERNAEAIVRWLRIIMGERHVDNYSSKKELDIYVIFGTNSEIWRVMDKWHHYPLHISAALGYTHVVGMLIVMGAFLDTTIQTTGSTALHLASKNGHEATVRLLLENGANRNLKDLDGMTPFDLADLNGRFASVKLLRDY